ncbi:MAG: SCE4755 family polysaccharide monooxygenase-like protein [Bryobacteraceae bacterium]
MRQVTSLLPAGIAMAILLPLAWSHFILIEPQSWLVQNDLGDPQKLGPCGGTTANAGTPTNIVNKVQGGQKLHIKVQETVFHPGHYRIALAVNSRAELPADPPAATRDTEKGAWSVSAPIQNPPQIPVLADGLFPHTSRQADPWETDVQLPNINCDRCTLQITQFMAEHGLNKDGGYYYHHCADLQIAADPAKPIDTRWSTRK